MNRRRSGALSNLEYHVLLALLGGPLYGYALKSAVETESSGTLTPRAGSLYRVLARLMAAGLVRQTDAAEPAEAHPGLERRYYRLTHDGRAALEAETRRLESVAALAARRLGIGRS